MLLSKVLKRLNVILIVLQCFCNCGVFRYLSPVLLHLNRSLLVCSFVQSAGISWLVFEACFIRPDEYCGEHHYETTRV